MSSQTVFVSALFRVPLNAEKPRDTFQCETLVVNEAGLAGEFRVRNDLAAGCLCYLFWSSQT